MNTVASIKEIYQKNVADLAKQCGFDNVMEVPRIEKVVVNVGIGKIIKESDKIEEVYAAIETIVGQHPIKTKARKSIAGFKIREGQAVGIKVTLRGPRMWDFLTRLINVALPRVRDFQGIVESTIDQNGNLNIGLTDHTVFPEIVAEQVRYISGLQITVVSTAKSQEHADILYRILGVPLRKEDK